VAFLWSGIQQTLNVACTSELSQPALAWQCLQPSLPCQCLPSMGHRVCIADGLRIWRYSEVVEANSKGSVLLILDRAVFDVTQWLPEHPGEWVSGWVGQVPASCAAQEAGGVYQCKPSGWYCFLAGQQTESACMKSRRLTHPHFTHVVHNCRRLHHHPTPGMLKMGHIMYGALMHALHSMCDVGVIQPSSPSM
jgi:hypothetical protein